MHYIDIHNTAVWFIASIKYSGKYRVTVFIVLHFVRSFVWDCSVLTQYSYYRDLYCSWPASRLRDRAIVDYIPPPGQQVSAILWNITIHVWLKSQVHCVTYFFLNAWHLYITKYRNTLHIHYFIVLGARFQTTGIFERLVDCQCILHCTIIQSSEYHNI